MDHLSAIAAKAAASSKQDQSLLGLAWSVDASWIAHSSGVADDGVQYIKPAKDADKATIPEMETITPTLVRTLPDGAEIWQTSDHLYIAGSAPLGNERLYVARILPSDFLTRYSEIQTQTETYAQQKQHLRAYKREILLALLLNDVAPGFHDDVGGAVFVEAGDGADSGVGRGYAGNFAREFRSQD